MNKKEKRDLIKLIKKLDILSWGIDKKRKGNNIWYEIVLGGYKESK